MSSARRTPKKADRAKQTQPIYQAEDDAASQPRTSSCDHGAPSQKHAAPASSLVVTQVPTSLPATQARRPPKNAQLLEASHSNRPNIQSSKARETSSNLTVVDQSNGLSSIDGTVALSTPISKKEARLDNPQRRASGTPTKQAYAGPTFHASPAASSLPMPRLFSRSEPLLADDRGAAHDKMLQTSKISEKESTPHSDNTKTANLTPQRNASPLDILFKAQREERARASTAEPSGKLSPDTARGSNNTLSRSSRMNGSQSAEQGDVSMTRQNKEIFMKELNEDVETSDSDDAVQAPRFTDQLQIAEHSAKMAEHISKSADAAEREAKTRALKSLIMTSPDKHVAPSGCFTDQDKAAKPHRCAMGVNSPQSTDDRSSIFVADRASPAEEYSTHWHEDHIRSRVELSDNRQFGPHVNAPTSLAPTDHSRASKPGHTSAQVQSMEENLRRMLNMQ
ncbi:MAG: hypothetical protein M1828_002877 [Chrysothrix sp. TS-e1954]|nr:MAG: hypothetical protein M1828_002877 [Chrysothrix sp. TS-e1954]